MIRDVDSPHLKACLDAPLAARQGVTVDARGRAGRGALQVLTHFGGEYERQPTARSADTTAIADSTLTPENYYARLRAGHAGHRL